jgi:hypothetical protein
VAKRPRIDPRDELERQQVYTLATSGEHGSAFLADLKKVFESRPSFTPGATHDDVIFAEGQKSVIRYIESQVRLGMEPRQKTAKLTEEDL